MTPTISIIVPIYNVEKYLEKCIKSVIEQSYHDFELILIPKMRFNMLFNYCLRTSLYRNDYKKNERITFLRKLKSLDKTYLNLLEGKTFLQKIDYILFKNNLLYTLDFILYNKSKYN